MMNDYKIIGNFIFKINADMFNNKITRLPTKNYLAPIH